MSRIVIIKHTGEGKYLFKVPEDKILRAGDMVLCQTRRGIVPGMCCCDSFDTDKESEIKRAFGAPEGMDLKPIVGEYSFDLWGGANEGAVNTSDIMDFDTLIGGRQ